MKHARSYTSCMHTHVRYYVYEPKVILRVKGVIQLHHGLGEHADRYEHFASYMLNQGFVVVVSDFAGHGKSLIDFEQGYFGNQNGPDNLVRDIHRLVNIIRKQYPDVPYFLMGIDLGSTLIRKYVSTHGDYVDGVILLGTPVKVRYKMIRDAYIRIMKKFKGPLYKSESYYKAFQRVNNKTLNYDSESTDWLTSDASQRKDFMEDPFANFVYTLQGYQDINDAVTEVNSDESISKMPTYLSVYIGVGENDPIEKQSEVLVEKYKKHGISDLTFEVFKERRHALLFERNKKEVYLHILNWLNERTYL